MRILVVSDGRRGIENQALGLAEAVARAVGPTVGLAAYTLTPRPAFAALPPSLQLVGRRDFGLSDADLVIGCGRQAVAPLISLRRAGHPAFTCYIQDPRVDPSRFDLVVAPEHDGLSGPFVETMIGSPHRVTRDRILTDLLRFGEAVIRLPQPRALIAIGGPSHTHRLDAGQSAAHRAAAKRLSRDGYSLLITASRRTPDAVTAQWQAFAKETDHVWLHGPHSEGDNPYFAFLGAADLILVTEDSTNMLTEACATGKPVFRLPMAGNAGKFQTLYDALDTRCHVRRWDDASVSPKIISPSYEPLNETARIAERLIERVVTASD